jgi:hypothetical protein
MADLPSHMLPRFLSPEQVATIRQAWAAGLPRDEVARLAGITIHILEARKADQLADLPKRPRGVGGGRRGVDPTPDEISDRAAAVRAAWPEHRYRGLLENDAAPFHPERRAADRRQTVTPFRGPGGNRS